MGEQTIVVTGVNGHVGNNLVKELLEHGYRIRGTVRDMSKAKIAKDHDNQNLLNIHIADVLSKDGWKEIMEGADGLIHTATVYSTTGDAKTILDTAIKGTEIVFRAGAAAGIKRVVYTSSVAAIGSTPYGTKDESNWNDNFTLPYTQAKTESEHLAWELAEELGLDLRVINPAGILGGSFSRPTPSTAIIGDSMRGKYPLAPKIPLAFVHVKDVAIAHRKAFEVDDASGRYILAPHQNTDIHQFLKRARLLYPKEKFPKFGLPKWLMPMAVFQDWFMGIFTKKRLLTRSAAKNFMRGDSKYSSSKAELELGLEWHSIDDCIHDTVEAYR